jgi:hypothetical protein
MTRGSFLRVVFRTGNLSPCLPGRPYLSSLSGAPPPQTPPPLQPGVAQREWLPFRKFLRSTHPGAATGTHLEETRVGWGLPHQLICDGHGGPRPTLHFVLFRDSRAKYQVLRTLNLRLSFSGAWDHAVKRVRIDPRRNKGTPEGVPFEVQGVELLKQRVGDTVLFTGLAAKPLRM